MLAQYCTANLTTTIEMANLLTVENLTKGLGDRILFSDICFGVDEGEKIGIIARNGTGKSTLLGIIAGTISADSGSVVCRNGLRIGYLPQEPTFRPEMTVVEAALDSTDARAMALRRYTQALACGSEKDVRQAVDEMDAISAWDYQDRLNNMLTRMGLSDPMQLVSQLSGGQRKRLALARTVLMDADFLLLDEPTNHLDIETIEWLEAYLKRSRATLLMVTHDRYFLDCVCNRILEMDRKSIFSVSGNYDMYLRRRAERIEAMDAELSKVRNILRKEQDWMSRQPQARGGKAKFRIDNFRVLSQKAQINLSKKNITLDAKSSRVGSKIFEAEGVCKAFGDKVILKDFTYTFAPGEKIGVVGPNGVGKSTFIKMLQGLVPTDAGVWNVGQTVRFGYYSQDGMSFDTNKKVVDAVRDLAEDIELNNAQHIAPMQYLQRFLFSPEDQQKYIYKLSGGERCRLHLATVLMRRPNFLILDEPTNDLDIITLGILEEYLAEFKGCAIVVSHDRFFLDSIVDHIFVMEGNGIVKDFPGNYTEYRTWKQANAAEKNATAIVTKCNNAVRQRSSSQRQAKLSYREQKELEALESEIAELEAEKSEIESFFASGGDGDYDGLARRLDQIKTILDEKETRWLELSEKA